MSTIERGGMRVSLVDNLDSTAWTNGTMALPSDPVDLANSFDLVANADRVGDSYPLRILQRSDGKEVKIWFQGVVLERQLRDEGGRVLGREDEVEPWISCQCLRLGAGWSNWERPFLQQMTALRAFIDVALQKLELPVVNQDLPATLFLRKPTADWGGQPYDLRCVSAEQSSLQRCSRSCISRGDVVDVRVTPEVVLVVGMDGVPRTTMFFGWDSVVKVRDRMSGLQDEGGHWLSTEWDDDQHIVSYDMTDIDESLASVPPEKLAAFLGNNGETAKAVVRQSLEGQYGTRAWEMVNRYPSAGNRRYGEGSPPLSEN